LSVSRSSLLSKERDAADDEVDSPRTSRTTTTWPRAVNRAAILSKKAYRLFLS
jgi:hypothetical protein